MKWTIDITRDLIAAVEERPALWDSSLDDHSRKNVTSSKWDEIGTLLNCKGADAKEKWRKNRVYFKSLRRKMLSKKSGQGANESFEPSWEFYKDMSFLLPSLKPKKSQCNLSSTADTETSSQGQNDVDETEEMETFAESEVLQVMTEDMEMRQDDDSNQHELITPTASKENSNPAPLRNRLPINQRLKKKKESDESAVMLDLMGNVSNALKNHKPKDTADDHFAAHLSCQLSQVPDSAEKERAKIRIMEVLTELKYGQN